MLSLLANRQTCEDATYEGIDRIHNFLPLQARRIFKNWKVFGGDEVKGDAWIVPVSILGSFVEGFIVEPVFSLLSPPVGRHVLFVA